MPFCHHCNEEMGYLPFKCKYCGGTFCKEHRLPENHDCTFEIKHTPTISPIKKRKREFDKEVIRYSPSGEDKKMQKFLKKQEKQKRRTNRIYDRTIRETQSVSYSTYLIIIIFAFSIAATLSTATLYLSLSSLSFLEFYIWTFFTAPFIYSAGTFFGIFLLFFFILIFYNTIRIIEMRFGGKFLLQLFLISTFFSGVLYVLLWLPFYMVNPSMNIYPIGLAFGGIIGIISFLIYFSMNTEMTMLIMFIPMRMKGKVILLLLALLIVIPALLWAIFEPEAIIVFLPDLGGFIGSYLIFKYKFSKIR